MHMQLRMCGLRSQMTLVINRQGFYVPFFPAASLLLLSASCTFWIHCTLQNTKDYDQMHLCFSLAPNRADGLKKPRNVSKARVNIWPLLVLMNLLLLHLTASRHYTEPL